VMPCLVKDYCHKFCGNRSRPYMRALDGSRTGSTTFDFCSRLR